MSIKPEIWLYLIGFLDLFGISMILPLLLSHGTALGASPWQNGVIGSVYGAIQLLSSPVCGVMSDRYGRGRVLTLCLLFCCVGYSCLALSTTISALVVARVLAGCFKHTQTLCRTMAVDCVASRHRQEAIGWFNSASSMAFIVGPPAGGYLAHSYSRNGDGGGFVVVVGLTSAIYVAMFVISVLFVREPHTCDSGAPARQRGSDSKCSDKVDWSRHRLLLITRFLFSLSVLVVRVNASMVWTSRYGLSAPAFGWLMSLQGVVSAAAGGLTRRIAAAFPSPLHEMAGLAGGLLVCLAAAALAPSIGWLAVVLAVLSLCTAQLRACGAAVTMQRTPAAQRGLVMGLGQNVAALARMTAPLLAGAAQQWLGDGGVDVVAVLAATAAFGASLQLVYSPLTSHDKTD